MSLAAASSFVPNPFGGFAPFPNTISTALLAYQSEAIGYGFGIKFQYAKRAIGAMSNEEFNALTPDLIGKIVEEHNTELIGRMAFEMPKWIEIQKKFIEASVEVEIAKANRTPSAWVEILQAFGGATLEETGKQIDSLPEIEKTFILSINPILAVLYSIYILGPGSIPTPPLPPISLPCEQGENWAVPTSNTDPTSFDVVTITFAYQHLPTQTSSPQPKTVSFAWPYATHMSNIVNFENFEQNSSNPLNERVNAKNILVEYRKGMLAQYGACGTPA